MPIDVSRLKIVHHPAAVLRQKARPVAEVNDEVRAVALRMVELMREAGGIGLAAPQVGLDWQMFVCEIDPPGEDDRDSDDPLDTPARRAALQAGGIVESTDGPVVYINPELSGYSRDLVPFEEGCLSLPRIRGVVRRPSVVTVRALGLDGLPFTQLAGGMLARCIQHEHDHLLGVLILEKMAQSDRLRNRSLIRELEAGASAGRSGEHAR
jgi:peptide deformylase